MSSRIVLSAGHDPFFRHTAEVAWVRLIADKCRNYFDFDQIPDGLGGATENDNLIKKINWANARQTASDFYISIHSNAGGGRGIETYYYTGSQYSLDKSKVLQSFAVAETGLQDRGVKGDTTTKYGRLGEVRDTKAGAWLIECGFHDSREDMKTDPDKFARAIAKFVQTLGIPVRNLEATPQPTDPCISVKNDLQAKINEANSLSAQLNEKSSLASNLQVRIDTLTAELSACNTGLADSQHENDMLAKDNEALEKANEAYILDLQDTDTTTYDEVLKSMSATELIVAGLKKMFRKD